MRHKLILSLFVIFAFILAAAGCGRSESTTVRIGIQTIPNTEAIVKANLWHEQTMKHANVKWLQFDSGRDVNTALAAGSIDIGQLGSTLVANGLSNHLDYSVIWIADVIGTNEALVVRDSSHIASMADLKGKTVAVTFGSTTQYSLLGALQVNKIDPKDVKIIDMRPPEMLAAWKRGDIDAGYVWQPTLQEMVNDHGKILLDSGQLAKQGIVTADVIVVRNSFAKQHPDLVAQYIFSEIRAVTYFKEHPDEAAADVAKEFSLTKEETLDMMKQLIWLTGQEQESSPYLGGKFANVLEDTAVFLKDQALIPSMPSHDVFQQSVNPSFIKQALSEAGHGSS